MQKWKLLGLAVFVGAIVLTRLGPLSGTSVFASGDSHYGLDFVSAPGTVANGTRFEQAMGSGASWDRFPLYWSSMQATQGGAIDFSATDATVNADLAHGFQVQGILVGAPAWATASGSVDLGAWSSFVSQTVTHYRGQVHAWEMWNEPDLLNGQGQGTYWTWGVPAYYQLLKAGYLAAKAADPTVTILMAGLAFPYNNQDFFPQLIAQIAQDPTAAANHGYFDVLPFHSYDRVMRMYQLPVGYLGSPSFAGFRPLLRQVNLNPAIWVNELGVPVWNYGSGQNAPGRATQDEQAGYFVESIADGLAAGIDHFFAFQLYDDGAGAVDPTTNKPAEYFGLVGNDGTARPAYQAYQSTINLFTGSQLATHLTIGRGSDHQDHKGVEVVTLYGTSRGKVTIAWSDDPGSPVSVGIPTNGAAATQLDKLGNTIGQVAAANGVETVSLPGATNNNNFDCFTTQGCDPSDYIIGGAPVILVENDPTVPSVAFDPLPFDLEAPVNLSWHAVGSATPATYDVQYSDAADGVWHDWLIGTTATSAPFGDGSMQLQSGHTYEFRARAHDAAGNLVGGYDYSARPLASTVVIGGNVVRPAAPVDAKIEILWPHGNLPTSQATKANLSATLFNQGTTISVNPGYTGTLHLWQAVDSNVGQEVVTGTERLTTVNKLQYPEWDFNDVDVSAARDPKNREYFWVTADGGGSVNGNIWAHGVDARTNFPQQDTPTGVLTQTVSAVDARIEIVWPHGNLPTAQATQVNVGVDLFAHGTFQSVPANYGHIVRLYAGVNNAPMSIVAVGDRVLQTQGGITYPTWQFNNVDVTAAQNPQNRIYFRVEVVGATTYPNIWTHGVDARTNFPQQDVPAGVQP